MARAIVGFVAVVLCAGLAHGSPVLSIKSSYQAVESAAPTDRAQSTAVPGAGAAAGAGRDLAGLTRQAGHGSLRDGDGGAGPVARSAVAFMLEAAADVPLLDWLRTTGGAGDAEVAFDMHLLAGAGIADETVVERFAAAPSRLYRPGSPAGRPEAADYRLEHMTSLIRAGEAGRDLHAYGEFQSIAIPTPTTYTGGLFLLLLLGGGWYYRRRSLAATAVLPR